MPLSTRSVRIPVRDITIFAALSAIMLVSRIMMQWIHGVHLLGLFIASMTLVYRVRALIPIYVYIMLDGLFTGFAFWWVPYLYIWLPIWSMFMIVGKLNLPRKIQIPLYMVLCGLQGLLFGAMYAPAWALFAGLTFEATIAWIIAGLGFDIIHAIAQVAAGILIIPLSELLRKLDKSWKI